MTAVMPTRPRPDQIARARRIADEARYWAMRYREASERVERAVSVVEDEGEEADDARNGS